MQYAHTYFITSLNILNVNNTLCKKVSFKIKSINLLVKLKVFSIFLIDLFVSL